MTLREFVANFVCPNTLIRLWVPHINGHMLLTSFDDDVGMEWEILERKGWQYLFSEHKVIGVKDILCDGPYSEAVNIVIEAKEEEE